MTRVQELEEAILREQAQRREIYRHKTPQTNNELRRITPNTTDTVRNFLSFIVFLLRPRRKKGVGKAGVRCSQFLRFLRDRRKGVIRPPLVFSASLNFGHDGFLPRLLMTRNRVLSEICIFFLSCFFFIIVTDFELYKRNIFTKFINDKDHVFLNES